jgi:hypothetical protein
VGVSGLGGQRRNEIIKRVEASFLRGQERWG